MYALSNGTRSGSITLARVGRVGDLGVADASNCEAVLRSSARCSSESEPFWKSFQALNAKDMGSLRSLQSRSAADGSSVAVALEALEEAIGDGASDVAQPASIAPQASAINKATHNLVVDCFISQNLPRAFVTESQYDLIASQSHQRGAWWDDISVLRYNHEC